MLLTIGAAVVVLGVLIFVHELGHFAAAKAVGIGVHRFSVGMGPITPVRFRRGETEYVLSWVPFGGYVKMATGEEDEHAGMEALEGGSADPVFPPEKLFENKPLWARILVISAGVLMNALFAWAAYAALAVTYGRVEDPTTAVAAVDATQLPGAAEALASVAFGSKIARINGDTMASWNAIQEAILDPRSDRLRIDFVERSDPIILHIPGTNTTDRVGVVRALRPLWEARVGYVAPGRPAAAAGLETGDLVVRANGDSIRYWDEFVKAIEGRSGSTVVLSILRDGETLDVPVVPAEEEVRDMVTGEVRNVGRIGVGQGLEPRRVRFGVAGGIVEGGRETLSAVAKVWFALKGLVLGHLSPRELGGPILIGQLSGQFARVGLDAYLRFMAFFSVNLAVLNLLPIPVLDGGHLVFLLIEGVRGKPLALRLRLRLSQLGMVILLGIMALAVTNDLLRLVGQ